MNDLFQNFRYVSEKEWKQKTQLELDGQDYTETLCKNSIEGFQIKPLYTQKDLPYKITRKSKINFHFITDFEGINSTLSQLSDGFLIPQKAINNIPSIDTDFIFLKYFWENIKNKNSKKIYSLYDPIGNVAFTGKKLNPFFVNVLKNKLENNNLDNSLSINLIDYQNAGAGIVLQLALMLSIAQEYIKISSEKILEKPLFSFAIGSDFFSEIAKIRASRFLWENFSKVYNIESTPKILTKNSSRNKSLFQKENNTIRRDLEDISAILGGADFIHIYQSKNEVENKKILQNKLSLKNHFCEQNRNMENIEPISGNYFIENLTYQLAEKAWNMFKYWENQKGFLYCMEKNIIQNSIQKQASSEQRIFDEKYKNSSNIDKSHPYKRKSSINHFGYKSRNDKVNFKTLKKHRLYEKYEKNTPTL